MAIKMVIRDVALATATEKPYQLPFGCKAIQIQCRTAVDIKMATSPGAVQGTVAPGHYFTIKSGTVFKERGLDIGSDTVWIFLAAASAVVAEIICTFDDTITGETSGI